MAQTDTLKPSLSALNPQERVEVLDRLAKTFSTDSIELSLDYQLQAYQASQKLNNNLIIIEQSEKVADIYSLIGQYNKALDYYNIALLHGKREGDYARISQSLRFIGNAYYYLGLYDKCLESHIESLDFAKKGNDEHGIAAAYNNIGLINMQQGNHELALENYQKAEKVFYKLKNTINQGRALINIGNIHFFNKDYHNALGHYQLAFNLFDKTKEFSEIALASQNLSIAYDQLGNIEKAIEYGELAHSLYEETNDIWGLANITHNIGYLYIERNNLSSAEEYFLKSYKYSNQTNSLTVQIKSLSALATLYEKAGNFENAFKFLKAQNEVVDSMYKMETERKLADLETKHELDKKNKEHVVLQRFFVLSSALAMLVVFILLFNFRVKVQANRQLKEKNTKIEQQNTQLAAINATKDKFFSIIAHDLKNPLSAFIGFIDVFQHKLLEMPKEEQELNLKQISMLAENMLDLLENLLKWGRSQVGALEYNPKDFLVNEIAEQAIRVVSWNAIAKSITIENNVPPNTTVFGDKNMLLTVLRNLLSNAVKFSYIGGKISVTSDTKDESVTILVKDNGIGISSEDQEKLFRIDSHFKSYGTTNESGTGLGLILCKEFIDNHGGKIIVHSQEGKGSVFGFTLKKPKA